MATRKNLKLRIRIFHFSHLFLKQQEGTNNRLATVLTAVRAAALRFYGLQESVAAQAPSKNMELQFRESSSKKSDKKTHQIQEVVSLAKGSCQNSPLSPSKSVMGDDETVSTLQHFFGEPADALRDIKNSPMKLLNEAAHFFTHPIPNPSESVCRRHLQYPQPERFYPRVTCEEVDDDEEDMVAIRGVRWREKTQLPFNMLLKEIDGTLNSTSSPMDDIFTDDETDDEINQYVQNNEGGQCGTPYQSRKPPTVMEARLALGDLENLLRPP
ncbi:hypothetical protein BD769DRAFT_1391662 [Suillus cothurnatus]|nr:hypothetical protein BD769DRAFT_1391662 [Suillus cothurnatus]